MRQVSDLKFQEIYGHKKLIAILKSAIARNRIAHAYLFYGIEGVGKKTVASVFARALNCSGEDPPCDACPSCLRAEHNNHPDIVSIQAQGQSIKIEAIKEIRSKMAFRPENKKRVFILKEADKTTVPAANALLKTLEEPSPDNVLILTTARPHALPTTILSRCQSLSFAPLHDDEVSRYLQEKQGIEKNEAEELAAASLGSIGRALEMKKEDFLTTLQQIFRRLAEDDPEDMTGRIAFAKMLGKQRDEIMHRLAIINSAYRDSLAFRETHEDSRLVFRGYRKEIHAIAERLSSRAILRNINMIDKAVDALSRNANPTLTLESMLVKLL